MITTISRWLVMRICQPARATFSSSMQNKLLYRGRIWVDAEDFAVVRIEAAREKPFVLDERTKIEQAYGKVGGFCFPFPIEAAALFGWEAVPISPLTTRATGFRLPIRSAPYAQSQGTDKCNYWLGKEATSAELLNRAGRCSVVNCEPAARLRGSTE